MPRSKRLGQVAALDIGTSKILCLIARPSASSGIRIEGLGYYRSKGIKGGLIADLKETEKAVRNALEIAEQMAGERIDSVISNVPSCPVFSDVFNSESTVVSQTVSAHDVRHLVSKAMEQVNLDEKVPLHAFPLDYKVDELESVFDPRGMNAGRLSGSFHVLSAQPQGLKNLVSVLENCHVSLSGQVIGPYASGLACLVDDEKELGTTVLDLGAGTTSFGVFAGGQIQYAGVVPLGGNHITNDLAKGLGTSVAAAERLKTLYGSALLPPMGEMQMIEVPVVGEERENSHYKISKNEFVEIIVPRLEEIFELVLERLSLSSVYRKASPHFVITGGGSQLQGLLDFVGTSFKCSVRQGKPISVSLKAEEIQSPAFATCIGLLRHAFYNKEDVSWKKGMEKPQGKFERIEQWFSRNF